MTSEDLQRIEDMLREVERLPKELVSPTDPARVGGISDEKIDEARQLIRQAHDLAITVEACLRALFGSEANCVKGLAQLRFDESLLGKRNAAGKTNVAWTAELQKFREQLIKAKIEGGEKARMKFREDSWKEYLKTGAARGIILTALIGLVAGFLSKDAISKWIEGVQWNKLGGPFPNFEVVEHERIVDLTEWTPVVKGDTTSQSGKSVFISNLKLRKIRDEGTSFCLTGASSGSNPLFTSSTHRISQHPIEMKLVGWPNMPKQAIAVLDIPPETKANTVFDANINSVRYRGFSDDHAEWCSLGIWNPTRKLTMVVKFPPGKMGHDFVLRTAFFYDKNNFETIKPDPAHYVATSNSVTWGVENPVLGNAYRLDWNW